MSHHTETAYDLDHAGPLTRVEPVEDGLVITFQRMSLKVPEGYVATWRGKPPVDRETSADSAT